jgi:ABC-2 type transport system ATP-binding protein
MDAIRTVDLTKEYHTAAGAVRAVDALSLNVREGTVFGFLGPNGAGKTTAMKILVGLAEPSAGNIFVAGGVPADVSVRAKIGFMPESPSFYNYLSGREFLEFVAGIFDISDSEKRISNVIKEVNLSGAADRQTRTYSKGMLQRLGLAQALLNDPDILFLDEPLDGLDPLGRAEVKSIMLDLRAKGKTIFFNSHILSDAEEVCDAVGIIDSGKLVVNGSPKSIRGTYSNLESAFVDIVTKNRSSAVQAAQATPVKD